MINISKFLRTSIFFPLAAPTLSVVSISIPNPKKEWTVCPSTFIAATPVGAITATFLFFTLFLRYFIRTDLPTPALPLTNTNGSLFSIA